MNRTLLLLFVCTTLFAQQHTAYLFTHVNVLPMTGAHVLKDQHVLVENGVIRRIGPAVTVHVPAHTMTIDGRGKFLMPGLSDMHVHLEGVEWNMMFPERGRFTAEEIDLKDILFVYLAHGITTIDVLFSFPEHLVLREKVRSGEVPGPRMILSRMIDGPGRAWPPPLGVWVKDPAEAAAAVRDAHREGYDAVKVYSFLDGPSYDTIIATGRTLGMPVDGHIPFAVPLAHVAASGQRMIAHIEEVMKTAEAYDPAHIAEAVRILAKSGTWVTSTLILNRNLNALIADSAGQFTKPGTELLHPMARGIWNFVYTQLYKPIPAPARVMLQKGYDEFQRPFAKAFFEAGGRLLTGTDALVPSTIPGISLHEELEELTDAGIPPYKVLRLSTTNAAIFLGEADMAGTIEPGKRADLVLLDRNPLEHISNTRSIAGVMTHQQWFPRTTIDRELREIRRRYAALAAKKR